MPLTSAAVAIPTGTTPTRVFPQAPSIEAGSVAVKNVGAATVYVGGLGVSVANGFPVAATESISVDLSTTEVLYAVADTTASALRVLGGSGA